MNKNEKPHISVAPMMDWTDRHCRYFLRLIAPNVRLYTEMVTTGALIHGDRDRFLRFDESEHPIALQFGGSEPADMTECAKMAQDYGYDEVNINCGCPSERVQKGSFGACLMAEPTLVASCVEAMGKAVNIPVTVKCRIGIDDQDSFEFLDEFVGKIADAGCKTFIIHARKAWLSGLSPKQNREVPELDYQRVKQVKEKYPHLSIILNGGVRTVEQVKAICHPDRARTGEWKDLKTCEGDPSTTGFQPSVQDDDLALDGVMIGREAYQNPYILADLEREIFGNEHLLSREDVARAMIPYIERQQRDFSTPIKSVTRHMMGLFHEQKGAKSWRRALSTLPYEDGASADLILDALPSFSVTPEAARRVA